jgi:DNA helicase-2/ATP-dependent DNA helicase PcrA
VGSTLEELLPAQRAAVTHPGGRLLVSGEAGSGKTRVVRERFLWLVAGGRGPERLGVGSERPGIPPERLAVGSERPGIPPERLGVGSERPGIPPERLAVGSERPGIPPERLGVVCASPARADAMRAWLEEQLSGGYEQLFVLTAVELAGLLLGPGALDSLLGPGERFAMLLERIDELSLQRHDFGGSATALLTGFVRRIDRLKAHLIDVETYGRWAEGLEASAHEPADPGLEREFAGVYRAHERMLADAGALDAGDLVREALRAVRERSAPPRFVHLLVDDADQFDPASAALVRAVGGEQLTVTVDPRRGELDPLGGEFAGARATTITLESSLRCPEPVLRAGHAALGARTGEGSPSGGAGLDAAGGPSPASAAALAAGLAAASASGPAAAPASGPAAAPASGPAAAPASGPALASASAPAPASASAPGRVAFWRCRGDRAQAQAVAADIERLTVREGVDAGAIAVFVPAVWREGQAVAVALEERAIPHRVVGAGAFFQRAEIRDLLAWLRLLADPSDAAAVVRALARPPIDLRSVDIARCTQIARRRKLDMVAALAAATESPQVPPEARERIHLFLKLYRAGIAGLDTTRPDLYVHRLIDRLGLRRQQLFAAQPDVVERLRALARFSELAAAHVRRAPQATPREFARSIAAVAESGLREDDEPDPGDPGTVQIVALDAASGLEVDHVYVMGLHAGWAPPPPERLPAELVALAAEAWSKNATTGCVFRPGSAPDVARGAPAACLGSAPAAARRLYVAITRARSGVVLAYPDRNERGARLLPAAPFEAVREALRGSWEVHHEELFGPAETLHSSYRMLRDELLEGTLRAGRRLGELRFDTDLDVSHAVARYLELLKLAALIARPEGQGLAEAIRDVNARILQAVTAEQREILTSSALDDYLLDAERDVRRRIQAIAARDEPSLEPFLPKRGEGVVLSASDIDTYRTCPLKYKFARVFRIPQEPTIHQRFGILVHQVLERFHGETSGGSLAQLLGLLDARWRRAGFGDSEEERQLRGKAVAALERYHRRFQSEEAKPLWFERPFTFRLGPHLLRGRVDRVDQLPGGEYELIDYKTGRPKSPSQLAEDVQLSLYAVGAREAWSLEASRQAYYYVLDDEKVSVEDHSGARAAWIQEVATEVAEGILSQGFEPTPSYAACSVCDYRLMCPAAER